MSSEIIQRLLAYVSNLLHLENVLLVGQLHQIESILTQLALGCLEEATGKTPVWGHSPKNKGPRTGGEHSQNKGPTTRHHIGANACYETLLEAGQLLRLQPHHQSIQMVLCKIM